MTDPFVLLFTGKGGVGKSTVSAGTAALFARQGLRTLVVSTDAAHSLGDAFAVAVGAAPVEVAPRLWVQHVDAQRRFEESWGEVQSYLVEVMESVGVDPVEAEELTVLPGAEEVLALLELRRHATSGEYDVLVVDCAPTAETLRLLALPEALNWYMDRVFPPSRRVVRALGPMIGRAVGVPMPRDGVFDAVERLHRELADVRRLLSGPRARVRLVMTPEEVVLAEARRSWTTLSLYGYRVDGVVVNRVFPDHREEPPTPAGRWLAGWVQAQQATVTEARDSFAPLPLWISPYAEQEPRGVDAVAAVAARLYPGAVPPGPEEDGPELSLSVTVDAEGGALDLPLPLAVRGDVGLVRRAGDLVVTCGSYRRVITLPAALARMRVAGAGVEEGRLRVRFAHRDEQEEPGR